MSYDLYVYRADIPEDCACAIGYHDEYADDDLKRVKYFNFTYNLSDFFTRFHVNPRKDLDGKSADDVADKIDKALDDIKQYDMEILRTSFEPHYRHEDVIRATGWLRTIRNFCRAHPDYMVVERS